MLKEALLLANALLWLAAVVVGAWCFVRLDAQAVDYGWGKVLFLADATVFFLWIAFLYFTRAYMAGRDLARRSFLSVVLFCLTAWEAVQPLWG